jgi:NMD protein affecting ribosome stability and mRNA decay
MAVPGVSEKIRENNRKKYGADYYTSTAEFKKKTKETFNEKYGGHQTKLSSTQNKKRKTNIEKYGFTNPLLNPAVKEKSIATNNEKYGGNSSMCSSEVRDKSKATNQKKHGVDWYVQSDEFKKKFTETMLARYGVEHAMHYTDSFEKSISTSYRKKIFVFPSGRIEKIQGYEGFAIIDLLNSGYSEDDIIVSNKDIEMHTNVIFYPDSENKKRKYYPDIFVVSENKIIEVKSHYTFDYAYTVNMRKRKASIDMGLSFEFWVYDSAGKKIIS